MNSLALCVPAYQAAGYLPRLLRSAHAQKIPFDEIWVYDDASDDLTSNVAENFGAKVVRGSVNVGCSAAKNVLLNQVKSKWIHFHDADDELLPKFTTLAHLWMEKPDCPNVVLFDYEYRDGHTKELIATSNFDPDALKRDPLGYAILNQINPFCGIYKTDVLRSVGGYDVDPLILYNEDVAFHIKLASHGLTFSAEKEVSIINYRISCSMSSSSYLKCLLAHVEVMRRTAERAGDRYPMEIKLKLWHAAQGLASVQEWDFVDHALSIGTKLSPEIPPGQSKLFTFLVTIFGERSAFRLREKSIRYFKPRLRK